MARYYASQISISIETLFREIIAYMLISFTTVAIIAIIPTHLYHLYLFMEE